jgi:tetratricopeptide (TPR) repeat protein
MNRTDLRPFWRSWLVVMVSVLLSKGTTLRGVPLPPDGPELLLLDGSIAEGLGTYVRAATTSLAGPGGHAVSMYAGLEPARLLQDAERKYRSALKMDPQIVEARLRLGRVLHLRDRPDEARPELEQARREAREPYLQYLTSLFLGQHDEAWATVRRVFGDEAIAQSPEDDPWWDDAYAQCWQAGRRAAELRAMVRR